MNKKKVKSVRCKVARNLSQIYFYYVTSYNQDVSMKKDFSSLDTLGSELKGTNLNKSFVRQYLGYSFTENVNSSCNKQISRFESTFFSSIPRQKIFETNKMRIFNKEKRIVQNVTFCNLLSKKSNCVQVCIDYMEEMSDNHNMSLKIRGQGLIAYLLASLHILLIFKAKNYYLLLSGQSILFHGSPRGLSYFSIYVSVLLSTTHQMKALFPVVYFWHSIFIRIFISIDICLPFGLI